MSKTTLPKELEQQFDQQFTDTDGDWCKDDFGDVVVDIPRMKRFIATTVARAEERVKQQVLELVEKYKDYEFDDYYFSDETFMDQLIEDIKSVGINN